MADIIRGAVIGYGGAFNMGRGHASAMQSTDGIECVAICDIDPERTATAKEDFPHVCTYNSSDALLANDEVDLVTIVLPHNLHAPIAIQILNSGKHAISEKPMCITMAEATSMIEAAKANNKMLSVYHNRRWDSDFWTLRGILQSGVIGKPHTIEMRASSYGRPNPNWWRSVKAISGGIIYDWGAHYIDWLLNIIDNKMINVTGFYIDNEVWDDISNEDHARAIIRFDGDLIADVEFSQIAKIGGPRWKILGTHGAIQSGDGNFKVWSELEAHPDEQEISCQGRPGPSYYQNIVAHLSEGKPLIVTPESARRVIAVMDLAEKSAKTHQAESIPYEF